MNRTMCLIKGLQIFMLYGDPCPHSEWNVVYVTSKMAVRDSHAKELEELGWYATVQGWGFNL